MEEAKAGISNKSPGSDNVSDAVIKNGGKKLRRKYIVHVTKFGNLKTKLESVSLSCKSHRSKTANITILFANSKHQSKLPHLYQSQACHKCKS